MTATAKNADRTPRNAVRRIRRRRGLTQIQAAARAGLTQSRWSEFETGTWPNPTIRTFQAAARALDCTIDELLRDEPAANGDAAESATKNPYDDDTPRSPPTIGARHEP